MIRTNWNTLNDDGAYRLAAAVMAPPGITHGAVLDKKSHLTQLAWLKGSCGEFWMAIMALIPDQVTSRYAAVYGVESGPARDCVTGACKRR